MRAIFSTLMIAGLSLGCLSTAGPLESQAVRAGAGEEDPPAVLLRIEGRRAAGSGELRVAPDPAGLKEARTQNLAFRADNRQRVEILGGAPLIKAVPQTHGPALRLRYEQRIEPDGRRVYLALLPLAEKEPALLVHLDLGGDEPIRKEILPGLILSQKDEPGTSPDVKGGAAQRTWLAVVVQGSEPSVTLEGGETRTISYRGTKYQLHVYRSLRRDRGANSKLPFEGERYLLTATLTPE
ncbi:MAG TPA: hypothetical protein VJ725_02375 [Thermoanaerobaculia bacterium]|nr:hypothetical protein [Thermoanaerobaculia bacterium]